MQKYLFATFIFSAIFVFSAQPVLGASWYIDYPDTEVVGGTYVGDLENLNVTEKELVRCPKSTNWVFEPGLGIPAIINTTGPVPFINSVFLLGLGSAGVAALLMMVVGGVQYMAAAGNPGGQGQAKERIQNALIGLGVLIAAFLILNTISPQFTNLIVKPSATPPPPEAVNASEEECMP